MVFEFTNCKFASLMIISSAAHLAVWVWNCSERNIFLYLCNVVFLKENTIIWLFHVYVNFQPNRLRGKLLSSGQDFLKKNLCSKHVLKVYFKPSRKNQDFGFLPLPSKLVRLTNPYLNENLTTFLYTLLWDTLYLQTPHNKIAFLSKGLWAGQA